MQGEVVCFADLGVIKALILHLIVWILHIGVRIKTTEYLAGLMVQELNTDELS